MRTHCGRGHPFTKENTYRSMVGRQCRACRKLVRNLRDVSERKALESATSMTPSQIRRLKDALLDEVPIGECARRFGVPKKVVAEMRREVL